MGLTLVTPPTVEPVSLEEARSHLRVIDTAEDTLIESYIRAATRHVEKTLGMSLMTRTYRLTLDDFSDAIELPRGPVQSVTSVQYVDEAGDTQTLATSYYSTDLVSSRQWVVRNQDYTYPTLIDGVNAVSITYVAGYDTLPAELEDLKHAILLLIGHWFNVREAASVGNAVTEVPFAVDALIQPHRMVLV